MASCGGDQIASPIADDVPSLEQLREGLLRQRYFADDGILTAVYLALVLGRPLLVEGEPGVGKTELARSLAGLLGRELVRLQCYEGLDAAQALSPASPVDRLLVLSGSCAPVTARQIRRAKQIGFAAMRLEGPGTWSAAAAKAHRALQSGRSVVLYTALGPQTRGEQYGEKLGSALGGLLRELVLSRGHAASQLDGLELALKGGQIGPEDFFANVRDGRRT